MRGKSGFTLIEIVIVMVIMGITVVSVAGFVSQGALLMAESSARVALAQFTRNVTERISREVQGSIPYQVSISGDERDNGVLSFRAPLYVLRVYRVSEDTDSSLKYAYAFPSKGSGFSCEAIAASRQDRVSILGILKSDGSLSEKKSSGTDCAASGNFIRFDISGLDVDSGLNRLYLMNDWSQVSYSIGSEGYLLYHRGASVATINADGRNKVKKLLFEVPGSSGQQNASHLNSVFMALFSETDSETMSVEQLLEAENVL